METKRKRKKSDLNLKLRTQHRDKCGINISLGGKTVSVLPGEASDNLSTIDYDRASDILNREEICHENTSRDNSRGTGEPSQEIIIKPRPRPELEA